MMVNANREAASAALDQHTWVFVIRLTFLEALHPLLVGLRGAHRSGHKNY
jgi:hypothetical protein